MNRFDAAPLSVCVCVPVQKCLPHSLPSNRPLPHRLPRRDRTAEPTGAHVHKSLGTFGQIEDWPRQLKALTEI